MRRFHLLSLLAGIGVILVVFSGLIFTIPIIPNPVSLHLATTMSPNPLPMNGTLHLTITVHNNLPIVSTPPKRGLPYPLPGYSMGPECGMYSPIGLAVYPGRYTVENVSTGSPLTIFNYWAYPIYLSCVNSIFPFRFTPFQTVTRNIDLQGNWTMGITKIPPSSQYPNGGESCYGILHPFQLGIYTIFVGDIWGDIVTTYFTVV